MGIAQHHRVWATLSTSLNDVSERSYAESVALEVVKEGVKGVPSRFTQKIAKLLRRAVDHALGSVRLRVFTVSFCDVANDSSQWLHYGRNGTGLALAFRGPSLPGKNFWLMPVSYTPEEQRHLIQQVIQRISAFAHPDGGPHADEEEQVYASNAQLITLGIRAISPLVKSAAFASEREWRLVAYEIDLRDDDGRRLRRHYRVHDGRIVPFVERVFSPNNLPIVGIELGYSCPMAETDPSFRMLGLGGVPIRRSTVAVRP